MNKIIWSPALTDILRRHYPTHGATVCRDIIRRTAGIVLPTWKVVAKARRMGIRYAGPHKGFAPGQTPHNKGKAMPPATYAKCQRTMFRAATVPRNHLGDGAITTRYYKDRTKGQRLFIRHEGRWLLLSHHTWNQHHGPIPPRHVIRHRDGNPLNCNIDNLCCVSRAELIRANYRPEAVSRALRISHFNRRRGNLSFIDAILRAI